MTNRLATLGFTQNKKCIELKYDCFFCRNYWNDACIKAKQSISTTTVSKTSDEIPMMRVTVHKETNNYFHASQQYFKNMLNDGWVHSYVCGRKILSLEEMEFIQNKLNNW